MYLFIVVRIVDSYFWVGIQSLRSSNRSTGAAAVGTNTLAAGRADRAEVIGAVALLMARMLAPG